MAKASKQTVGAKYLHRINNKTISVFERNLTPRQKAIFVKAMEMLDCGISIVKVENWVLGKVKEVK